MGEHADRSIRGIFYVTTNGKPPYARGFPGKSRRRSSRGNNDYMGLRKKWFNLGETIRFNKEFCDIMITIVIFSYDYYKCVNC